MLVDGETIAAIGADLAAAGLTADETIDAAGALRPARRDRRPHPHGAALRRARSPRTRSRPARGPRRSAARRRSSTSPSSRRASRCARGSTPGTPRPRATRSIDYGFHMIMSDVNDETLTEMDALVAEGDHRLQALHGLSGRLLQRRRRDLPGDAADREERRPDHDARRERHGDRRRRRDEVARRQDRSVLPRRRPLPDLRGRGDEPRHPPGRGRARAAVHRPSVGARRAATRCARRATAASAVFAETCPQYLFLSLDDMGNGFDGAKFICSPPLRHGRPLGPSSGRA